MIRRPPRSTQSRSSAASDVYKRQVSRPVRSVPNQWSREGPWFRARRSMVDGSNCEMIGAPRASTPMMSSSTALTTAILCRLKRRTPMRHGASILTSRASIRAPRRTEGDMVVSLIANPRIDERIGDIGDQVGEQDDDGENERQAHHDGIVAIVHAFNEDGSRQHCRNVAADYGCNRDQRVAQGVPEHHRSKSESLGASGADVILRQGIDHGRARVPHGAGDVGDRYDQRWQHKMMQLVEDARVAGGGEATGREPAEPNGAAI